MTRLITTEATVLKLQRQEQQLKQRRLEKNYNK